MRSHSHLNRRAHTEAFHKDGNPAGSERLTQSVALGDDSCPFERYTAHITKGVETRARNKVERESRLALRRF